LLLPPPEYYDFMENNTGAKSRASLKISSRFVGQWVVRPIARILMSIRIESGQNLDRAKDEILERIERIEKSIEAIAREVAKKALTD